VVGPGVDMVEFDNAGVMIGSGYDKVCVVRVFT